MRYSERLLSNSGAARGVEVLRAGVAAALPLRAEDPAAHAGGVAVLVADRPQHAAAELVDDADAARVRSRRRRDPRLHELLGLDAALLDQAAAHHVPAVRGPAQLGRLDRGVREAAAVQVVERRLAVRGRGQDLVVERDRHLQDVTQPGPVRILALRPLVDLDAGLRREHPQGLREGHAVALHHEREHVAAEPAAEALPGITARGNRERRRLLAVERAQALEGRAGLLQLDRLADHVDDVQPALDLCLDRACRLRCLPDMTVGLSSLDKPLEAILRPKTPS